MCKKAGIVTFFFLWQVRYARCQVTGASCTQSWPHAHLPLLQCLHLCLLIHFSTHYNYLPTLSSVTHLYYPSFSSPPTVPTCTCSSPILSHSYMFPSHTPPLQPSYPTISDLHLPLPYSQTYTLPSQNPH